MGILDNKHLKWAMLIAPVLAIVSYIGVDYAVSERPLAATEGRSYPLAAKSNCRYTSGHCTLKNGDVELRLAPRRVSKGEFELKLSSNLPLQGAVLSVFENEEFSRPASMQATDDKGEQWRGQLALSEPSRGRLRVAVILNGASYFVETSTAFFEATSQQAR